MTALQPNSPLAASPDLGQAATSLVGISDSLRASYQELSRRAERVERELVRANAELESKVRQLDEVKGNLEAILEALPTGVVVRDRGASVTHVNRAASEILGLGCDELLRSSEEAAWGDLGADGEGHPWIRPDGQWRVVASRTSPIDGPGGGSVEIIDDRTRLTQLTERVHRMDKMAALGNMAAGIAHEIRNPMNAIQGFASLLLREPDDGPRTRRWASLIVQGATEIDAIVTNMLTLARPDPLALEVIDPRELVRSAVDSSHAGRRDRTARWTIATEVSAPRLEGDRIKLRQALRNLVSNAMDVQPDGGQVEVTVTESGGRVLFAVSDAGPGVPAEVRDQIFDPFFTTRADGTGLGLALVSTIAALHGGSVDVDREPSSMGGALITLSVPLRHTPSNAS